MFKLKIKKHAIFYCVIMACLFLGIKNDAQLKGETEEVQNSVIASAGSRSNTSNCQLIDVLGQSSPIGVFSNSEYQVYSGFLGQSNPYVTVVESSESQAISAFILYQNYPNPFNPETTIQFKVPYPCQVSVQVFNVIGQRMTVLANQAFEAGMHTLHWNISEDQSISTGVYFIHLQADDFSTLKKALILK